ncbi:hypothetical protein TI03_00010 [Achromatium sp. WMS1]|nr:hypothetical protein TI03_00010 [Achromatium sp. WMS1]
MYLIHNRRSKQRLLVIGMTCCILATTWPIRADIPDNIDPSSSIPQIQVPEYAPQQPPTINVPSIVKPSRISSDGNTIIVNSVVFSGDKLLSEQQLQDKAAQFLRRPLDSADVEDLRYQLTRLYIENGYINSGAIIRGYDVQTKCLYIHLQQGIIKDVDVHVTGRLNPEYITGRLNSHGTNPLHLPTLQERFWLLNYDDPAIGSLTGDLVPSLIPGESILTVQAQSKDPFSISLILDNYAPVTVGEKQGTVNITLRNLGNWGDVITLGFNSNADKKRYGFIDFNVPINYYDTRVHASYQRSTVSIVQPPLDELDIESDYKAYTLGLTHPIIRTPSRNVTLGVNINHKNNTTKLLDTPISFSQGYNERGESSISTLNFTQYWSERTAYQAYAVHSTITFGGDFFGITETPANSLNNNGQIDNHFVMWLLQQTYAKQWWNRRLQLLGRIDMQIVDSPLPSLQQTAVGGANTVRGYRENTLVRDQMLLGSLELRYALLPSLLQGTYGRLEGAVFTDIAQAWNKDSRKGANLEDKVLHSIGVGLLWHWQQNIQAQVYWGHQLKNLHIDKGGSWQEDGIHAKIQITY